MVFTMPDPYTRIFLLSHMRARTSLAGHILGSHPQINGYFEMHISYEDASALDKALEVYRQYETFKVDSRYLFDKLLHNDYRLCTGLAGPVDMKILVALREPEQAIRSMVALFAARDVEHPYASVAGATRYYVERIGTLADFCRSSGRPYYYYDAECFQTDPKALLSGLAGWLELDSPLSERYQRFSQTGKARMGDSSGLIQRGTIGESSADYAHIHLPDETLGRAQAAYRDCRSRIVDHATDALTSRSQASRSAG